MIKEIEATYDGKNLILEETLNLPINSKFKVMIDIQDGDVYQFIISNAKSTGMKDWSVNHDYYLYGVDKNDE